MTEYAVVFTHQMRMVGEYPDVAQTLNTPFSGPGALERAKRFCASESQTGDFPESEGWYWHTWGNEEARVAEGKRLTDALFGPDPS